MRLLTVCSCGSVYETVNNILGTNVASLSDEIKSRKKFFIFQIQVIKLLINKLKDNCIGIWKLLDMIIPKFLQAKRLKYLLTHIGNPVKNN